MLRARFGAVLLSLIGGLLLPPLPAVTPSARGQVPAPAGVSEIEGKVFSQWLSDLRHADPAVRERACVIVCMFPAAANNHELVKALIERLKFDLDAGPRVKAVMALGNIALRQEDHRDVVSALTAGVTDPQAVVRHHSALLLPRFGDESRSATLALLTKCHDPVSYEIRRACLEALIVAGRDPKGGPPDARVVGAMIKAITDTSASVRLAAAVGLGAIGKTTDPQLAPLVDEALKKLILDNRDRSVTIWAHVSQMSLDNKLVDKGIKSLAAFLKNADPNVRVQALRALGSLGDKSKPMVPQMLDGLLDKDQNVVFATCVALVQMEAGGPAVTNALDACGARKDLLEVTKLALQQTQDRVKKFKP